MHFISSRTASPASDSVRIKLDSHRIRVEIVQKDVDFKQVVVCVGFNPHVSEAQRTPLLIQRMLPIDHLPAHCAFICSALAVGGCSREIVLLGIVAHRAA